MASAARAGRIENSTSQESGVPLTPGFKIRSRCVLRSDLSAESRFGPTARAEVRRTLRACPKTDRDATSGSSPLSRPNPTCRLSRRFVLRVAPAEMGCAWPRSLRRRFFSFAFPFAHTPPGAAGSSRRCVPPARRNKPAIAPRAAAEPRPTELYGLLALAGPSGTAACCALSCSVPCLYMGVCTPPHACLPVCAAARSRRSRRCTSSATTSARATLRR